MLYAYGALEFATAASRALKRGLFGDVRAEERRFAARSEFVEICPQSKDDFLRVEHLACVGGGAMFGASAAFHAGERLQGLDARHIFAGDQPEILVSGERRNAAEPFALEEHRRRTEHQVQMLGVRDERQKNHQRGRMQPPHSLPANAFIADPQAGEVGQHQRKNQQRDDSRFR